MNEIFEAEFVWQDREIRFDVPQTQLNVRAGEEVLELVDSVEDTKANNGEVGFCLATNLRFIWRSLKNPRTNMSVGFSCIQNLLIKIALVDKSTQSLHIIAQFADTRFEFVFSIYSLSKSFLIIQSIHQSYGQTRLYRELKLRGAIIHNSELKLLPLEQIFNKIDGVWNLSSDQGNLGTFYLTNVRVVWFAELAENFNVSVPYIQIRSVRIRSSKFGPALVIETQPQCGGYVLGFKLEPPKRLNDITTEVSQLHQVYNESPIFGVKIDDLQKPSTNAFEQIDEGANIEDIKPPDALIYTQLCPRSGSPVFDDTLGLAVEVLPTGKTLESLWSIAGQKDLQ